MGPPPLYRSESRREDAEDDNDENDEITKLLSSYAPLDGRQFLRRIRWTSHTQIDLHEYAAKEARGSLDSGLGAGLPPADRRRRIRHYARSTSQTTVGLMCGWRSREVRALPNPRQGSTLSS